MRFKQLEVYSKPASYSQKQWEAEFLNDFAYPEIKRRGLTDQQVVNWFGIRYDAIMEFKRERPQHSIKRRLAQ